MEHLETVNDGLKYVAQAKEMLKKYLDEQMDIEHESILQTTIDLLEKSIELLTKIKD